ncbi:MAG TPA: hypothetical protein VKM72_00420 [Thermoanaerobaculia bacterium]|nr:hypothetical protein [Thermoanaerobaculia bacterium]
MDMTMHEGDPQAPEPGKVKELLTQCRPEIEALFRRHWVSEEEAEDLLDSVLLTLLVRWDRIIDPAAWLLRSLEKSIRTRLLLPIFGPGDPD